MPNLLFIIILSYLVGSIPTSIILTKVVKGVDVRNFGSGNAGGTNVSRVLGKKYGLLTILLDAFKGVIAVVFISRLYFGDFPFPNTTPFDDFTLVQIIAGVAAVIGHIWTIFAGFKGGKGIATGLGVLVSVVTLDMLMALGIFVLVVYATKYISLASISAALSVPIIMIIRENLFGVDIQSYHSILPFIIALALLVVYTHRANVARLINGTENKISFSKKNKNK
ncbi:MAG: acyl-phosphate glycerol 3-phosphate acyltransferase [Ignavibacteriae bacterium]|nr:MAG: acyl-phosphate glycerol 3-phosphate acyltransferase [Ignavibacteriota bacterium]